MAIPFTPLTFSNNMPSGYALDENFTAVQTALQSGLSRTSSTDNEMQVDLDMNNNDILNINKLSVADFQFSSINDQSIQELIDEAYNWAQYPVDDLVPEGNNINEYSAFHYSVKASNSADDSADSAAAALASENEAAALLVEFESIYWGSFAAEPAVNVNGESATTGDLYYNTTDDKMYVYGGTAWQDILETDATNIVYTPSGDLVATDVQAALDELDDEKVPRTSPTGAAELPTGTTAQRPAGQAGYFRYNAELATFEGHNGTEWGGVGGATGAGGNPIFYENDQTVTGDYTIPADKNASSTGPLTIDDGVTVTVSDGATWVIH